tara:strand:- start:176 stop:925 length:750 start_codon:yes stop_codon:yes gene_type:complete
LKLKSLNPTIGLKMPKAVVFDLDNTLYPYEKAHQTAIAAVCDTCCHQVGLSKAAFWDYLQAAKDQIKCQLGTQASSHSRLLYFQRLLELVGLKSQPEMALQLEGLYWQVYIQHMTLFDGVELFLQQMRHRNIPLACVTDLTAQIQMRKLMALECDRAFDWLVTSEEAGSDKKDLKPFYCLGEKLRLSTSDTLWMIGDSPVDALIKSVFPQAQVFACTISAPIFKGADFAFDDYHVLQALMSEQSSSITV